MTALEKVTTGIAEIAGRYADRRVSIFDVQVEAGDPVRLTGRVLEDGQLAELRQLGADVSGVQVMRRAENAQRAVRVNLTSLHGEPGWLAEQVSQLLYGMELEILAEKGNWGLVRQTDGYLGWAYLPYLTSTPLAAPTHLALAPISLLHPEPEAPAIVGRVLGGTYVAVQSIRNGWAQIEGPNGGWLPLNSLRALNALPQTPAERRAQIVTDAFQLMGVQYLWGGCSAHGIDCSGLAQLAHRWIGITIPRDADMQYDAGKQVEYPFKPGDLLFFGEQGESRSITHVGISLGGWEILHSSRSRNGVYTDNVQAVAGLRDSFLFGATFIGD